MNMQFNQRYNIKRNAEPLSEDRMRQLAPSIFADDKHDSRSARYTYIPTIDVVRGLVKEGFHPVAVRQSNTRDESRADFTKHMIRFRRDGAQYSAVGQTLPEVVLVNSHDGTSSYQLDAGLFRLVCLNGMVVNSGALAHIKVPHKGDVLGQVIEGAFEVIDSSVKALEAPREWSQLQLAPPERAALAEAAHVLRFADAEGNVSTPIKPDQLLHARRFDDRQNDLWTTFNAVQENVIRGGLSAWGRNETTGRPRRVTTREVKGIDQDIRLNKALWTLAERMAQIKAA
jgi:hypothetical protein